MDFTAAFIALLVGTLITVFFAYFPGIRVKFALLAMETQSLIKLGIMVVIAGVMFGLSFTSIFPPPLDLPTLLSVIVALILSNQPVASLLPTTRDVRVAILQRIAIEKRLLLGD
jgi:ABC-type dipeptide/oligopeptide/nickel transport system permease subunit